MSKGAPIVPLRERFDIKYNIDETTGCWVWHAATDGHGYGQMRVDGRSKMATHISLELAGHKKNKLKPCALHKCDNPACVNPEHLWWGTKKENTKDMMQKGRHNHKGLSLGHKLQSSKVLIHIATCDNCEIKFRTSPRRAKKNKHHFCSKECTQSWQKNKYTGKPISTFSQEKTSNNVSVKHKDNGHHCGVFRSPSTLITELERRGWI